MTARPTLTNGTKENMIDLRDYVEAMVEHERELRERGERDALRALEAQAVEYARRLDLLNHEASKLASMQATYVPREVFDNFLKQWSDWRTEVDKTLTKVQTIGALAIIGLSVLSLVLRLMGW